MLLLHPVPFSGIWQASSQCDRLTDAALIAARDDLRMNEQQLAHALGVPHSRLSELKAGTCAGPGVGRLFNLPAVWWVSFIKRIAPLFGLRVYHESEVTAVLLDAALERKRMARMSFDRQESA